MAAPSLPIGVSNTGIVRAVTLPPDEALARRRHELAVLAEVGAVRREEEDGAVECPPFALDDTDHEIRIGLARNSSECVDCGPRDIDARLPIAAIPFAAFRRSVAHDRAERHASRVGAHERLGKDNERRASTAGFESQRAHLLERAVTIECDRRSLNDSHANRGLCHAFLVERRMSSQSLELCVRRDQY